jgi:hypothetical protein
MNEVFVSEQQIEKLRVWKKHALENHHCMSEWQLTCCFLIERCDAQSLTIKELEGELRDSKQNRRVVMIKPEWVDKIICDCTFALRFSLTVTLLLDCLDRAMGALTEAQIDFQSLSNCGDYKWKNYAADSLVRAREVLTEINSLLAGVGDA